MLPITESHFGELPNGEKVYIYTLSNPNGMRAKITNYGATLVDLHVPTNKYTTRDVVLGFPDLVSYTQAKAYFGATVGRIAGRLSNAQFTYDGHTYKLPSNNGFNHLHGGHKSIDKTVWKTVIQKNALILHCTSHDGHEGYPGNVDITVTYRLNDHNGIEISYTAKTDKTTPLSLTNHSYFNLSGASSGSALNHKIQILADDYVPAKADGTLSDLKKPVIVGANDLRELTQLSKLIQRIDHQHGDNYLLASHPAASKKLRRVGCLISPQEDLRMDILTTEACMQFYTGRYLDTEPIGKNQTAHVKYAGLCFECHDYPNAPNAPNFPNILLHPGETYTQKTIYQFTEI